MGRGRLRVYLGAAPGVGKTYAMLDEGHRRAERGTDVVVGFVETHGRRHTAELLDGLEVVPRARARPTAAPPSPRWTSTPCWPGGPQVALVDELAHTNVPGSRNEKRWQDVEELLDAGIDVITTVNIQHLESLNDVVEKITGVPQRETVPDAVVRAADQIELVDMAPEALRRRMAHGNVYARREGRRRARQLLPGRQPHRAARAGPALAGRQGRRGAAAATAQQHDIDGHLGGPRARRRRADRRARGRDADPPGRPDRRPLRRRRPARRARRPLRRAHRRQPRRPGRAAAAGRDPRRHLPPGRRRRRAGRPAGVRPRGERHPARARRQPPLAAGRAADRPGHRRHDHPRTPATSTSTSSPTHQIGQGLRAAAPARQPDPPPAAAGLRRSAVLLPAAAHAGAGARPART